MKRTLSLYWISLSLALAGCSGGHVSPSGTSASTLQAIQVSASGASLYPGQNLQCKATGTYSNGSSQDLTASASWSSSDSTIATVSAGVATGKGIGSVTVKATSGGISGSTTLSVTTAPLVSIAVLPPSPVIAAQTTQQFKASGTFADGTTGDVTSTVTWSSSALSVASISTTIPTSGLAQGLSAGQSTITALSGNVSGSAVLTVTSATLTSLAVGPADTIIPLGTIEQLTATGTFSDGSTQDVTNIAKWSSSAPAIASVTSGTGLVTAKREGTANITATIGSVQNTKSVTVNLANLVSIVVTPTNPSIANGTDEPFIATGTFNDGATRDLAYDVTWSSSNPAVAIIGANGIAISQGVGTSTITASAGGISGSSTLTTTNATLLSISVGPANASIARGTAIVLTPIGTFSDGTTQNLSLQASWKSDNTAIASVDSTGTVTGVAAGTANISASLLGITGSAPLTVTGASPVSIAITPGDSFVPPAGVIQYRAVGTFSDGTTQNITNSANWVSSDNSVATIVSGGRATGQKAGNTTITATLGSISANTALLVTSASLVSITINPPSEQIASQTSSKLDAVGTFSDGGKQDLTSTASWTSSNASVATVGKQTGVVSGMSPGITTITAVFNGVVGSAAVTVTNATLTSVAITPNSRAVALGTSVKFSATGTFSDGTTQDLTNFIAWSSSNPSVAFINGNGTATTAGTGTTSITATLNGVSGSATLTVN